MIKIKKLNDKRSTSKFANSSTSLSVATYLKIIFFLVAVIGFGVWSRIRLELFYPFIVWSEISYHAVKAYGMNFNCIGLLKASSNNIVRFMADLGFLFFVPVPYLVMVASLSMWFLCIYKMSNRTIAIPHLFIFGLLLLFELKLREPIEDNLIFIRNSMRVIYRNFFDIESISRYFITNVGSPTGPDGINIVDFTNEATILSFFLNDWSIDKIMIFLAAHCLGDVFCSCIFCWVRTIKYKVMDWAEGKEQKINAFLTVKESGNGYTGSFKENTDQSSYVFVDSTIIDPTFIPNEVRANITCNCGQEYAKLKQEPVVYVSDCCTKRGCQGTCTTKYRDSMYVNKVSRRKEYGWVPVINESNFGTTEEGTTNYYIEDFECPCSNSLLGRNQDSIFVNLFTLVTIFGYPLFSVLLSFLMFFCNMINSGEVMFNKGRRVVVSDTGTKLADGSDLVVNLMEKERNGHDSFSNGCSVGNGKSKKKGKQRGNSAQGRTELPQENGPKNRKSSSPLKMNRKSDSPIPCNGHLSNGDHCNNTYSNLSDVDEKFEDCLTSYKESIEVNSKLKEDLEKQKELEEELNKKINKLENNEYTLSAEIAILQLKVDSLESKNSIINKTREKDALTIQKLDKLVTDSGLKKVELEKELANERKKALVKEKVLVYECSVNCKHKVALYEAEIEKLKDSNKTKEHTISSMSSKLRVFEEEAKKSPINEYSIEFIKMRETVEHLQNSLSDETKFKQVLFRGLMTAKNEIETLTEQIRHLGGKVSPKSYIYDCNQGSSQTSPSADGAIINGN